MCSLYIILNMIDLLFCSANFKTTRQFSARAFPPCGETRIDRRRSTLSSLLEKLPLLAGLATVLFATTGLATTPNYVQGNYATPQTAQTKVTVTYKASQTAGDLNVVIVGWN